jgi:hypothetical protein
LSLVSIFSAPVETVKWLIRYYELVIFFHRF